MVELIKHGVYLLNGKEIVTEGAGLPTPDEAREQTITYGILRAHDVDGSKGKKMRIRFDAMISHDITYVGVIQTARASGMTEFPLMRLAVVLLLLLMPSPSFSSSCRHRRT